MWQGTGGNGKRQAACLCVCVCVCVSLRGTRWPRPCAWPLTSTRQTARATPLKHTHTHTQETHAPSVTGPWQAWPRRGGWAKRSKGGVSLGPLQPSYSPLSPLSLSHSPFSNSLTVTLNPLLSFPPSNTHTLRQAGWPCQPQKTDTSSARWPLSPSSPLSLSLSLCY